MVGLDKIGKEKGESGKQGMRGEGGGGGHLHLAERHKCQWQPVVTVSTASLWFGRRPWHAGTLAPTLPCHQENTDQDPETHRGSQSTHTHTRHVP